MSRDDHDRRKTIIKAILLAAVLLFIAAGAYADTASGWKTEIAPYAWFATVSGDFTTNGLPVSISESLSDVPDVLDFGGMLAVESTKDRAAILFDTVYVKLSDDRTTSGLALTESVAGLAGAYTVLPAEKGRLAVDVLAGLRFWYVKDTIGNVGLNQAGSQSWIDQFLGARARWAPTKDLLLVLRGEVGGFGVESKWSWNAVATVQYSLSDLFSIGAGYRALYGRYENGDFSSQFKYAATVAGPFVGVAFQF
jgi:hypothetical protein